MPNTSMQKSIKPHDIQLKQKTVMWEHPRKVFTVAQIDYTMPVFGSSQRYSVTRTVVEKQSASIVLPYDPVSDQVVLIEQVRPTSVCAESGEPSFFEFCAGLVDAGESADEAAIRELKEESGLSASHVEKVSQYWASPGWTTEIIHFFCACVDSASLVEVCGKSSESETMRVFCVPADTLFYDLDQGKLDNGGLLIGALWLARHRDRLRRSWTKS